MASLLSQQQPTTSTHPRPLGSSPAFTTSPLRPTPVYTKKMSIAQTYFLAHRARAKLSYEAAKSDHNLRLLVGHANLLDSLMLELADAEREQESWFNQSVRGASSHNAPEERHVQWADTIAEEPEHDWHAEDAESDSDSDADSDFDDEEDQDIEMADAVTFQRIHSHAATLYQTFSSKPQQQQQQEDYDMDEYDEEEDEEDFGRLALQRTPSHSRSAVHPAGSTSPSSPPELEADDSEDDSAEDESMPPSPPTAIIQSFPDNAKTHQEEEGAAGIPPTDKASFYEEGFYLPPRNPARLISAISVY
ncbi:hypothetical protein VTJ49DRAFT_6543 [Mycothermus thermophilus]|uniref:Protein ECM13 n=1 Tax=Humicola insolens TaxID=85995 RepID=A0ABR3V1P6_HUMIN